MLPEDSSRPCSWSPYAHWVLQLCNMDVLQLCVWESDLQMWCPVVNVLLQLAFLHYTLEIFHGSKNRSIQLFELFRGVYQPEGTDCGKTRISPRAMQFALTALHPASLYLSEWWWFVVLKLNISSQWFFKPLT